MTRDKFLSRVNISIKLLVVLSLLSSAMAKDTGPDLIRRYNRDFYFSHPYQPFSKLVTFNASDRILFYVASRHSECEKSQARIDKALKHAPELVVIEGLYKSWGICPTNWEERVRNGIPRNGCDVYYAYQEARRMNIPFLGIEAGKMSNYSSYERDKIFLKEIFRLSNTYKSILVVYGAGHFVQQELALEAVWGRPTSVY